MAEKNDTTTIIEGLEATRRALQHVDAIAGIVLQAEDAGADFEYGIIGTNMSAIRTALIPTFEAIENAIIVLDGGKVPEPFEPGVTEPAVPPGQVSNRYTSVSPEAADEPTADAVGREYYAHRDREKSGNISGGSAYDDLLLRLERVDSILMAINDAELSGEARNLVSLAAIARSEIVAAECVCEANSKRWDSALA